MKIFAPLTSTTIWTIQQGSSQRSVSVKTIPHKSWVSRDHIQVHWVFVLAKLQRQNPTHAERTFFAKLCFRAFIPPNPPPPPFFFLNVGLKFLLGCKNPSGVFLKDQQSGRKKTYHKPQTSSLENFAHLKQKSGNSEHKTSRQHFTETLFRTEPCFKPLLKISSKSSLRK